MHKNNAHYRSIDFAKGILILFVVITHYAWRDNERALLGFPYWIDMAVPMFMIISGFVYTKSFEKNKITTVDGAYTVPAVLKKAIRYTLPFCVVFLAQMVVFYVVAGIRYKPMQIFNLFLTGGIGPGSYYYPVLMQFIFVFPVIYAIIRRYRFKGLVLCGVINLVYEVLKSVYGISEVSYRLIVLRYILVIAYGCYMATADYKRHKKLTAVVAVLGIAYITLTKYHGVLPIFTRFWTGTSMWACLFVIAIARPLLLNNIKFGAVEVLGKASYHIFLAQMFYYGCYGATAVYANVQSRYLQLIISFFICIVAGTVFYFAEKPISRLLCNTVDKIAKRI